MLVFNDETATYCAAVRKVLYVLKQRSIGGDMARKKETDTVQLGLRIKERLRKQIEDSASTHGCSMNDEVTTRIEQSFLDEEKLYGDPSLMALVHLLVGTIRMIEVRAGKRWVDDDQTRNAVAATVVSFLAGEKGAPFHKPLEPDGEGGWFIEDAGINESNQAALFDAVWGLLKVYGSSDQTIEMVERLIRTDKDRRRGGGGRGLTPED
jgi:hypothetical protein